MLVEGRHFFADADPESLGHKTLAVNLSDMAAMGAAPRWALLAGALPGQRPGVARRPSPAASMRSPTRTASISSAATRRADRARCASRSWVRCPAGQALRRDRARSGRRRLRLGRARRRGARGGGAGRAHLARRRRARARLARASRCRSRGSRSASRCATSRPPRIDVSDGLTGDLAHMLARSHVGAVIDLAAIPRSSALAADARRRGPRACARLPARGRRRLRALLHGSPRGRAAHRGNRARSSALPLTRIGSITGTAGLVVHDERGVPLPMLPRAFDHFTAE